jgi:peroxiredoxin
LVPVLALVAAGCQRPEHPALAIGAAAPDISLRGADGQMHALADYMASPVLAVVFTCNHCPAAQLYEARLGRLYAAFHDKGLALVAINPDSPKTVRLDEMGYTDVDDSLDGMKERVALRRMPYPYLYDGDTQAAAAAFGVVATPQMFIFDRGRKLRYAGRIDDNADESRARARDGQNAIEALLANQPVRVATTRATGCPIRWLSGAADVTAEQAAIHAEPVTVEPIGAADLTKLRGNGTNQITLVNFWATWCAPCIGEFPELQKTYRMYKGRGLRFVTVSANTPDEKVAVINFLREYHATSTNRQFDSDNIDALETAFDPKMPAALPFTLLIAPNGDVLHQQTGEADAPALRRAILASLADDSQYPGMHARWTTQ